MYFQQLNLARVWYYSFVQNLKYMKPFSFLAQTGSQGVTLSVRLSERSGVAHSCLEN